MINMIHEEAFRHIYDFAVHRYCQPLFQDWRPLASVGIVCTAPFAGIPFVSAQPIMVVGVHDGVLALRKGDPAERVAVTQPSVP